MVALLVFALFYMSIFPVSGAVALGVFFLWTGIFLGVLAAFEKMFKDIEEAV